MRGPELKGNKNTKFQGFCSSFSAAVSIHCSSETCLMKKYFHMEKAFATLNSWGRDFKAMLLSCRVRQGTSLTLKRAHETFFGFVLSWSLCFDTCPLVSPLLRSPRDTKHLCRVLHHCPQPITSSINSCLAVGGGRNNYGTSLSIRAIYLHLREAFRYF